MAEDKKSKETGDGWVKEIKLKKPSKLKLALSLCMVIVIAVGAIFWVLVRAEDELPLIIVEDVETLWKKDEEEIENQEEEILYEESVYEELQAESEEGGDAGVWILDENENEYYGNIDTAEYTEEGIHRYEFHIEDCTWSEAFDKARQAGGYLLRINSMEEYQYIIEEAEKMERQNILYWIGGRRELDRSYYFWVDSNNVTYGDALNGSSHWDPGVWLAGEPSYRDGEIVEHCLDFYFNTSENRWVWNDVPDDVIGAWPYYQGRLGYVIEFED